jgi:hypothetical protein
MGSTRAALHRDRIRKGPELRQGESGETECRKKQKADHDWAALNAAKVCCL